MAQHDFTIDNQTFPATRSDINSALQALASLSSGASSPSTTFAYQLWVNTTADPNILNIRNSANNAWIKIGEVNQGSAAFILTAYAILQAGSAAAPSFSFDVDRDTGMYRAAANIIGFATNGTERFRVGDSGQLGIGGATYGTSGQVLTSGGSAAAPSWASPTTTGRLLRAPQLITTGTSYTTPAGCTLIMVRAFGGGGGGGGGSRGSTGTQTNGGGGGGCGAHFEAQITVSASTSYTISVGAGGAAGTGRTGSNGAGTAGGDGGITSIIVNGVTYAAGQGTGGGGGPNSNTGSTSGLGGLATPRASLVLYGDGNPLSTSTRAGDTPSGENGDNMRYGFYSNIGGEGGAVSNAGSSGIGYSAGGGGGGSGASNALNGYDGASGNAGILIITEYAI
jgi:hypothetical protein